jgi:pyrroline-5-carboxylate reductase
MDKKIGFIGTGFMGSPMIKSIAESKVVSPENIYIFDIDEERLQKLKAETGANFSKSASDIVEKADIIFLAVKPNMVKTVLNTCKEKFDANKILVSIAAGIPIKSYKEIIGEDKKVIRAMPNQPVLVGEGMTLISYDSIVGKEEAKFILGLLSCMGKVEILEEKYMSEVIALTSSSPAYVFMLIEAMADAAVLSGIPRELAYKLASQAVLGSAKMVLETGKHPGELKDQVCSPAGTTIEAVTSLEKSGFRSSIIVAMNVCTEKARELGKIYG